MNIEQAKAISIPVFLDRAGYIPTKVSGHDAWYISAWRNERTASIHVHTGKNVWYDHGDGIGGTVIDLASELLKAQGKGRSVSDALQLLQNVHLGEVGYKTISAENYTEVEPKLSLTKVSSIRIRL